MLISGKTFAAVSCLGGAREGQTVMYQYDTYPSNAIGPVSFIWKPIEPITAENQTEAVNQRQLWLWFHPCCFEQIWQILMECFELTEIKDKPIIKEEEGKEMPENKDGACDDALNKTEIIDDKKEQPFICDKYKTCVTGVNKKNDIMLKSLTGSLLRYRLTGPQSNAVLADTLQQANIVPVSKTDKPDLWWKNYYAKDEYSLGHVTQREWFEGVAECQSPAELPPHCVVAMTTRDPRLTRPVKRTKVESTEIGILTDQQPLTPDLATSPLWNMDIRQEVVTTKQTDFQIHNLKSELLVPGIPLELGDSESRIPVIAIQRPGVTSTTGVTRGQGHNPCQGRGSGWDILLPKSWGMPFWLALVYRGARCGGLREAECSGHEERSLLFPNYFPDTSAGHQYEIDTENQKIEKYNKYPPAKRPNFTKFGVVSPFRPPWNLLVKECRNNNQAESSPIQNDSDLSKDDKSDAEKSNGEASTEVEFSVLRQVKVLRQLQCDSDSQGYHKTKQNTENLTKILEVLEKCDTNTIIPIKVDMIQKGCPEQFAMVCVPTIDDLEQINKDKNYGGPVEPLLGDPLKDEYRKLKKDLKDKNIKKKIKMNRTMKSFVEKDCEKVNVCSRQIIGYLKSGGFSLGTGNGGGVGFVAKEGLVHLLQRGGSTRWTVLVRNSSSVHYRFAKMSVII